MKLPAVLAIATALVLGACCSPAIAKTGIVTYEEEYLENGYTMCAFQIAEDGTNVRHNIGSVYRSQCIGVHKGKHVKWDDNLGSDGRIEVIE
jgi:hypothetical protein